MSNTPIFDSLSEADRKAVDHYVSSQINRFGQAERDVESLPEAERAGQKPNFDVFKATEHAAALMKADGATAQHLRNCYDAVYTRGEQHDGHGGFARD